MDSEDELTQFNQLLSECSKLLIESGCSSNRLESLLAKLGGIWNFEVESLALPTGVSIMVKKNGKQSVSLSRVRNWQINLDKIQQINDAVDLFFSEKPEISEALKTLKAIEESPAPYPAWLTALAGGGASSTLIYMLGGNRLEVLISFPLGILIATLQKQLSAGENRRYLADFLSSLAAALISGCLAQYISGINENRIITGGVILLLPGLVLLNAIHEIAQKNLVSGAAKTVEVLIIGSSISFGIGVATALLEIF